LRVDVSRPAIDPRFVELLLSGVRDAGFDVDALFRRAGISPNQLDGAGARLPQRQFAQLISVLTRSTRDEFWLLGSRPIKPGTFRLMCRLVVHCTSLRDAIRTGCQFYHLVADDFVVRLVETTQDASLHLADNISDPKRRRMVNGAVLQFAYGLMCWLVGRRLPLNTVHYAFPEEQFSSELEALYQAPLFFDQRRTEICFDRKLLDLPIMPDEQRLRRFFASMPNALLVRYRDDSSVAERVRGILRRNLKRSFSLEDIAGMLDVSPQTLRRRLLEEENCGFQEIKDGLRRDMAIHLLKQSRLSLEDIGAALGFAELSTFYRAFRRWTGAAPGEYRERTAAR
jgi:AraC-like DNA-binding protein